MSAQPNPSPLDNLHIASPCSASWDAMNGDDKARFCKGCQKNVFNISLMSRQEAEALIRAKEGNLCVRFAQREDGTVITQDCPVGVEKSKVVALRPWRYFVSGISALIASLVTALGGQASESKQCTVTGFAAKGATPAKSTATTSAPVPAPPLIKMGEMPAVTMGKPAMPVSSRVMTGRIAPAPTMGQPSTTTPVAHTMGEAVVKTVTKQAPKTVKKTPMKTTTKQASTKSPLKKATSVMKSTVKSIAKRQ